MLPLISVVLVILGALGIKRLLPRNRKRRRQVRFIRETLAANRTFDNRRVIASLSTVPDRINNLTPTI
jgi:RNase P/RNase MRP subunit p30